MSALAALPPSVAAYLVLLLAVAGERFLEVLLTRRNARWAAARGGEIAESNAFYALMVATHAAILAAAAAEVVLLARPFRPALGLPMLALVAATMALRYWAIATLGPRWSTRVVVVPGLPVVTAGPYRFVRHPNYVAVILEVAALPLVHGAWWTAIGATLANAALLVARIRHEERALERHGAYAERLGDRPRFLPRGSA